MSRRKTGRGAIAWMAGNPVAANLALVLIVAAGLVSAFTIRQEVFPEVEMDTVTVTVPYPGASPEEVEQGVIQAIEEAVRGVDDVDKVTSTAAENMGSVVVELVLDADTNKVAQDIKNAVDRVTSLPENAERPVVSVLSTRREVISVVLHGELDEHSLRALAEKARDDLIRLTDVTVVEIFGLRDPEISIEVPTEKLRSLGLTLDGIAGQVRRESLELSGGGVKTAGGEVLLRTAERRDFGDQFEEIDVVSTRGGAKLRLGEIAEVIDGFADTEISARFEGRPAAMLKVYRIGDQTPIEIADQVHGFVDGLEAGLPPGVEVSTLNDNSEIYRDRLDLLLRNAYIGLALVLLTLGLLLEIRLAFWVTLGIPISFLGAIFFVPAYDVTINMISLFAFILALGMVVDDAIVVGENIYEYRKKGVGFLDAAIRGARDVAMPVVFSVLTTMAAFLPMLFVPGFAGKMFKAMPAVVISILTVSLLESLFILPAHLAHVGEERKTGLFGRLARAQARVSNLFVWLVAHTYAPFLRRVLAFRYLAIAAGLALLAATVGVLLGGRVGFSMMPKVDSDVVTVNAVKPFGVPVEETRALEARLIAAARGVLAEHGGTQTARGIYSQVGELIQGMGPHVSAMTRTGSHLTAVQVLLRPSDQRQISAVDLAREWRARVGDVPGMESRTFNSVTGPSAGAPVAFRLSHSDIGALEGAAAELADALRGYSGVSDIDDGFSRGKPRLDFKLKPEARSLGVSVMDLASQVRSSFYGAEALRQQRGRDEVRVMVRLPEAERRSEHDIERLLLRTRDGGEIPIAEAASVTRTYSFTEITRVDGNRVVDVTADLDDPKASATKVLDTVEEEVMPGLIDRYPGLGFSRAGEAEQLQDAMKSLMLGWLIALVGIFGLLAVPLRSYAQPLFVVMAAIPYGSVGAVAGLLVMGFDMSMIAVLGIVALSGVLVNGSLVLVHAANKIREEGASALEAISQAGQRRFRPIVLTSVTTFFGLAPMIFETSMQARFLIPMAITLGFGVLFGTFVTLLLVPSLYMALEDVKGLLGLSGE